MYRKFKTAAVATVTSFLMVFVVGASPVHAEVLKGSCATVAIAGNNDGRVCLYARYNPRNGGPGTFIGYDISRSEGQLQRVDGIRVRLYKANNNLVYSNTSGISLPSGVTYKKFTVNLDLGNTSQAALIYDFQAHIRFQSDPGPSYAGVGFPNY